MLWFIISLILIFIIVGFILSFFFPARLFFDMMYDNVIVHGDRREKKVSITFDDGPHPEYTPKILDVLRNAGIKASFFLTGENADAHPEIAKKIYDDGHDVGIHAYDHVKLIFLPSDEMREQLKRSEIAIANAIGETPKLFRPPYGYRDPRLLRISKEMGFYTVIWDVTAFDWKKPGVEKIVSNVMKQTHNGSVILLHDGRGDRSQTVEALKIIIEKLTEMNYNFIAVSELINERKK